MRLIPIPRSNGHSVKVERNMGASTHRRDGSSNHCRNEQETLEAGLLSSLRKGKESLIPAGHHGRPQTTALKRWQTITATLQLYSHTSAHFRPDNAKTHLRHRHHHPTDHCRHTDPIH